MGPILTTSLKCRLTIKFFKITFCLQTFLQKIYISQAQSNWLSFHEASTCKKQGRGDLHTPDMNMVKWVRQQLRTVVTWVLSCVTVIAQSDTRNIKYVGWSKKISLEQLLFGAATFFRDLLERIGLPVLLLLPFSTFANCEGPFLAEGFNHNFCPCFYIVFAPLGFITRTSNKIVEIVVTSECHLIINPFKK